MTRPFSLLPTNRYERLGPENTALAVDLLVPNLDVHLRQETFGGRSYDSMPGLGMALARPLVLEVSATLSNDEDLSFTTRVPSVEGAIILKAYAWRDRRATKDEIDLHNLFRIVEAHPLQSIGGWRLDEDPPQGARRDAGRILHPFAESWETRPPKVSFDYRQVVASIRSRIARPT